MVITAILIYLHYRWSSYGRFFFVIKDIVYPMIMYY